MTKGWRSESARHSLARKGIKTGKKKKKGIRKILAKIGSYILPTEEELRAYEKSPEQRAYSLQDIAWDEEKHYKKAVKGQLKYAVNVFDLRLQKKVNRIKQKFDYSNYDVDARNKKSPDAKMRKWVRVKGELNMWDAEKAGKKLLKTPGTEVRLVSTQTGLIIEKSKKGKFVSLV